MSRMETRQALQRYYLFFIPACIAIFFMLLLALHIIIIGFLILTESKETIVLSNEAYNLVLIISALHTAYTLPLVLFPPCIHEEYIG